MLEAESASSGVADVGEAASSGFAEQRPSQSFKQPLPEDVKTRAARHCFPASLLKRVRSMMATPDYNAISVLYVLRPGLNFSFDAENGPSRKPIFTCKVSINEETFEAKGLNKKVAKLNTAEVALKAIMCESDSAGHVSMPVTPALKAIMCESESAGHVSMPVTPVLKAIMCESDSAGHVSMPVTPSSSSSSLDSKDSSAAAMVVKSKPVMKEPEPVGSNPLAVLNGIRPGLQYFEIINSEDETLKSTGLKLFRMGVVIDGERFEGSAIGKKLAKYYAAEAGLKKVFGLECVHTSDGIPVFTGDVACLAKLKESSHEDQETQLPQVLGLPKGKHPLAMINELYPGVTFTFGENSAMKSSEKFSAFVRVENTDFEGKGRNKKFARLDAAIKAVTFLKTNGFLEQRIHEKRHHKSGKPKFQRPQRPAFLNSSGKPFRPPKPTEEKAKDAVQKLKEAFERVDYEIVSESTVKNDEGEAVMDFIVSATVMGKAFRGCGSTKQQARLEAAEAALQGLDMWTEEDEILKQNTKRVETEKARFARMLYGSNRTRGSGGGSRDWRSQGKSWVSGGILAPNPLILPESKNPCSGGNSDDRKCQTQFGSDINMGGQQNEFGMGPPNRYNMGPQNEYGMGPVNDFGMGPSNRFDMNPLSNYGFQAPDGFRMGEQSGYGMGQSTDFRGCYTDFGNGNNFCNNPSGPYSNWWN